MGLNAVTESRIVGIALWLLIIGILYLFGVLTIQPKSEKEWITFLAVMVCISILSGVILAIVHYMFRGTF